ncbi:MAG TPA: hypothetical protein VF194_18835 [Ferrovibrio sp.]|uniref:hypothetical protein n=1 Tax=Ferrovibrio sp. TaxID=1917215 RepID=UPI002ED530A8
MRRLRLSIGLVFALGCGVFAPSVRAGAGQDVWDRAYDAAQEVRFIPLQLIIGGAWDGQRRISYPQGQFIEPFNPGIVWSGPRQWKQPRTGEMRTVYDRLRGASKQIFAVRHDQRALGRVADAGEGIEACDEPAQFPLGRWRQGELRKFDYVCWVAGQTKFERATIIIQEIDYSFRGIDHCLRVEWLLQNRDDESILEHRVYVFAPERGVIFEQEL